MSHSTENRAPKGSGYKNTNAIEQNKNFVQSRGGKTGFFSKLWYNERVAVRVAIRRSGLAFPRLYIAAGITQRESPQRSVP